MAETYRRIHWLRPQGMLQARAAFLSKDEQKAGDPLAYRVLLILATLYRRWACTRLRDLDDWIQAWIPEGTLFVLCFQTNPGN